MAVSTFTWMSAPTNASDVQFRKWAQGIHDALAACGMVQTADTGQVDLATVTVPAANTAAGYEIWRFNDAAQATAPIFLKIEYGSGYTARVGLWLTVMTGSDGAGTLTGYSLQPRQALTANSSSQGVSASEFASYASGDGSSIAIVLWPATTLSYAPGGFVLDRSRTTAGSATADAIVLLLLSGLSTTRQFNVIGCDGTHSSAQHARWGAVPVCIPHTVNGVSLSLSSTLSEDGVTAPVIPVPCAAPGVVPWVANSMVVVHPGDAGATSVITAATINGESRIYRAFPYVALDSNGHVAAVFATHGGTFVGYTPVAIAWAVA